MSKSLRTLVLFGATVTLMSLQLQVAPAYAQLDTGSLPPLTIPGLQARINNSLQAGNITPLQARQFNTELERIIDETRQYESTGNAVPRAILLTINSDLSALNTEIADAVVGNSETRTAAFKSSFNVGVQALENKIRNKHSSGLLDATVSTELESQLHDLVAETDDVLSQRQEESMMSRLNLLSSQLDRASVLQMSTAPVRTRTVTRVITAIAPQRRQVRSQTRVTRRSQTAVATRRQPTM